MKYSYFYSIICTTQVKVLCMFSLKNHIRECKHLTKAVLFNRKCNVQIYKSLLRIREVNDKWKAMSDSITVQTHYNTVQRIRLMCQADAQTAVIIKEWWPLTGLWEGGVPAGVKVRYVRAARSYQGDPAAFAWHNKTLKPQL